MCTQLKISPTRGFAASPVHRSVCGGSETSKAAVLPLAASIESTPKMEISVYMSHFRYCLNCSCFLSFAMNVARLHILTQILVVVRLLELGPFELLYGIVIIGSRFLQSSLLGSVDMPFFCCGEKLFYLNSLVDVVRSAAEKRSFHDRLWPIAILFPFDHWHPIRRQRPILVNLRSIVVCVCKNHTLFF